MFRILSALALVFCVSFGATSAMAGGNRPLRDKFPDSVQCSQARIKPVPQLKKEDTFAYIVKHALAHYSAQTQEQVSRPNCDWVTAGNTYLSCQFTTSAGKNCVLDVFGSSDRKPNTITCM